MDNETWILIDKIGIAFSILLMTLAVVGEALGWWGELGLVMAVASLVAGFLSVLDLNGRRILSRFSVQESRMDQMLGKQDQALGKQDKMIETLERIATILDDRLPRA